MKKQYQITTAGKKELEEELTELKARRGEVAEKIANARDFGDLSENAEYDAAREEQGLLETRIAEIEETGSCVAAQNARLSIAARVAQAWFALIEARQQRELQGADRCLLEAANAGIAA